MVQKLRERSQGEGGFTLVELLVVMLILGLLAAIAIPSFFNQRDKARDADAKSATRTAQTAMETFATDNQGSYTGATDTALKNIESTLNDAPGTLTVLVTDSGKGYEVSVASETGNVFKIKRYGAAVVGPPAIAQGQTKLTCTTAGSAGCPSNGTWG